MGIVLTLHALIILLKKKKKTENQLAFRKNILHEKKALAMFMRSQRWSDDAPQEK